jgi:hypothetical protein
MFILNESRMSMLGKFINVQHPLLSCNYHGCSCIDLNFARWCEVLFDLVLRVQQKVLLKMQQSCPLKGKAAPQANLLVQMLPFIILLSPSKGLIAYSA